MAKMKPRLVTASEELSGLVDKGYGIDVELKNKTFEDKGIKKILTDKLESEFKKGPEQSIRIEGSEGAAVVTRSEKVVIKGDSEEVSVVRECAEKGLYGEAVTVVKELNVPVDDRERAAKILIDAGIKATVSASMSVVPEEYRMMKDSEYVSVEQMEARSVLDQVVEVSSSFRVKYEKI